MKLTSRNRRQVKRLGIDSSSSSEDEVVPLAPARKIRKTEADPLLKSVSKRPSPVPPVVDVAASTKRGGGVPRCPPSVPTAVSERKDSVHGPHTPRKNAFLTLAAEEGAVAVQNDECEAGALSAVPASPGVDDDVAPLKDHPSSKKLRKKGQRAAKPSVGNTLTTDAPSVPAATGIVSSAATADSPVKSEGLPAALRDREATEAVTPSVATENVKSLLTTNEKASSDAQGSATSVEGNTSRNRSVVAAPPRDTQPSRDIVVETHLLPSVEYFSLRFIHTVGIPFIFSTGPCGVAFRDGSCMMLDEVGASNRLTYINKNRHRFTIRTTAAGLVAIPRRLEKKLFCVLWCRQNLKTDKHALEGRRDKGPHQNCIIVPPGDAVTQPLPLHTSLADAMSVIDAAPPSPSASDGNNWTTPTAGSGRAASETQAIPPPIFVLRADPICGVADATSGRPSCAAAIFFLSNKSAPYPNDTYYNSDDDAPSAAQSS